MCRNDITFQEVLSILKQQEEGHRWMRSQLHDERRDCAADPEMVEYLPRIRREIAYETGCIDTLVDLIENLEMKVEEMRIYDELERMFS